MVTLNELDNKILDIVSTYTDEVKQAMERELDETAKSIIDYIKQNAPRSGKSDALADSFITEVKGEGINKVITIFSKTKGRIVHLIEFGFKHKSGRYVGPHTFLRPAFDTLTPKMIEDIKRIIENGGS